MSIVNNWSYSWSHGKAATNGLLGKWPSPSSLWVSYWLSPSQHTASAKESVPNVTVPPNISSHNGHQFLQGRRLVSLLQFASARSEAFVAANWISSSIDMCIRRYLGFLGCFFLVCRDGDNRLLALETQIQPTFHVSWQTKAKQHVSH